MTKVWAVKEELGERDAFEDGELTEPGGGEGSGEAADLVGGAEGLEGVGGGAGLELGVDGKVERGERVEDQGGEAVVVAKAEEPGPVHGSGGEGLDGVELVRGGMEPGGEQQELDVRRKIVEREHDLPR